MKTLNDYERICIYVNGMHMDELAELAFVDEGDSCVIFAVGLFAFYAFDIANKCMWVLSDGWFGMTGEKYRKTA